MPPRKPKSNVRAEDALAERILLERERREMSPATLADWMTKAGCPMTQSAIWKIENGNPRRRITFDEAVAFAKVFGMTVQELAQPPEVVHADRASDLVSQLRQDAETRVALQERWGHSIEEIGDLMANDPTGLVCEAVNAALLSPGEILLEGRDFDVETWRAMPFRLRRTRAEHWKDTCAEEDALVRVRLAAEDVARWERVATALEEHEAHRAEVLGATNG
jgi:transcriptional regulator with XRE-family HTH domain